MKKSGVLLSLAVALSALLLTACNDYVGKEKTHPLFIKAGTAKNAGNYQEAAKLWEEFLTICPKSAETHFRLASVYGDNLDEPLKAVYHYRKYLELAPNDTTNAEDINGFAELAKKRLYEKLKEEYKDSAAAAAGSEELQKTQERLNKYVEYSQALERQNQLMKQRLREIGDFRKALIAERAAAETAVTPRQTAPAAAAQKTAESATAASSGTALPSKQTPDKLGTYKVQPGDSLIKISRKIYGSNQYYKLIADANKDTVPANMQLKAGQMLKIPPLPAKKK